MTDFRALCAELLRSLENYPVQPPRDRDLCLRARAALAEQPVGPTDEELEAMWIEQYGYTGHLPAMSIFEFKDAARAVLACWGQPAVTLIPVAERLPGPEDCDTEGKCWLLFKSASMKMTSVWSLVHRRSIFDGPYTHWLPVNALPVPSNV